MHTIEYNHDMSKVLIMYIIIYCVFIYSELWYIDLFQFEWFPNIYNINIHVSPNLYCIKVPFSIVMCVAIGYSCYVLC